MCNRCAMQANKTDSNDNRWILPRWMYPIYADRVGPLDTLNPLVVRDDHTRNEQVSGSSPLVGSLFSSVLQVKRTSPVGATSGLGKRFTATRRKRRRPAPLFAPTGCPIRCPPVLIRGFAYGLVREQVAHGVGRAPRGLG